MATISTKKGRDFPAPNTISTKLTCNFSMLPLMSSGLIQQYQRATPSKWQNMHSLLPYLQRTLIFDNHTWMKEQVWKSSSLAEKFQDTVGGKQTSKQANEQTNWRLEALKRHKKYHLILFLSPLPQGSTAQCQASFS